MRRMTGAAEVPIRALSARAAVSTDKDRNSSVERRMAAIMEQGRMLEEHARERLARARARVQREERKREIALALEQVRERRTREAAEAKADLHRRRGKELLDQLEAVPKASVDEVCCTFRPP